MHGLNVLNGGGCFCVRWAHGQGNMDGTEPLLCVLPRPPPNHRTRHPLNPTSGIIHGYTNPLPLVHHRNALLDNTQEPRNCGQVYRGWFSCSWCGGFTVPRYVVVTSNVVCITRTRWGLKLRIRHGSLDYTIPLDQIQYEALINALTTHWGWIPPECPRT